MGVDTIIKCVCVCRYPFNLKQKDLSSQPCNSVSECVGGQSINAVRPKNTHTRRRVVEETFARGVGLINLVDVVDAE